MDNPNYLETDLQEVQNEEDGRTRTAAATLNTTNTGKDSPPDVNGVTTQGCESSKRTCFADLPNELRIKIYEIIWKDTRDIVVITKSYEDRNDLRGIAEDKLIHRRLRALSMCSRRVRHEFLDWYIPKMCSEKQFRMGKATSETLTDFLTTIPALNATFQKPVPIGIVLNLGGVDLSGFSFGREFDDENDVFEAVQNIAGIEVLPSGSYIHVRMCDLERDGKNPLSLREIYWPNKGYRVYCCFRVKEEEIVPMGHYGVRLESRK